MIKHGPYYDQFLEPLNSDFNDILILMIGLQEPNIGGGFYLPFLQMSR